MSDFFVSIWENINLLVWFDWLIIAILIGFLALGIKRGPVKELANLTFLILAVVIAWLFYQWFAETPAIAWLSLSEKSHLSIAFSVIFVGILLIKKALYKLTEISSKINNPCVLNRTFALLLFLIIATFESLYHLDDVANLNIMQSIVSNSASQITLSFIIVFTLIVGTGLSLVNILNISIDTNKSCLLAPLFQKILNKFQQVHMVLNAYNINSIKNQLFAGAIGITKGFLVVLIMVLVLQNIEWISQQHYWIEGKNVLGVFQNIAMTIKPELSQYLLFIENK